jgi:microcystin-dependent protein
MPLDAVPGMLGMVLAYGGSVAPRGCAFCDGRLLSIGEYQEVFSLIGVQFGGVGRSTFALPDPQGRAPLGADDDHPWGRRERDGSTSGGLAIRRSTTSWR